MKRKLSTLLVCAGLFSGTAVIAQVPQANQQQEQQVKVTDAELEKFAAAYQGIQVANQDAQKKMIAAVEEQDLKIETFNEIHQAKMQNKKVEASKEDQEKHAKAVETLDKLQPEIQAQMEKIITDAGLTVERFEQINTAMQSNPEILQRLQKIMSS
ncbi:DUF4168 domain-containing protein [Antarcticibacterium sp. 1MA-6-2]|uniref:DUF4168 domain-containing protein n=1 Tax=Antarcticibacterium sp. 1MA-6-2 TaxID=2908210 RepID=UPI001F28BC9A|nr:DUF4168 domain-containing protein [Antarcticibacterium sp. 1MA-6-2]UJH92232.1 DUF4168 domain-containing protein [Antarcticibacterium sp. 1MA-6-2]